jgi:hypothetical protein
MATLDPVAGIPSNPIPRTAPFVAGVMPLSEGARIVALRTVSKSRDTHPTVRRLESRHCSWGLETLAAVDGSGSGPSNRNESWVVAKDRAIAHSMAAVS